MKEKYATVHRRRQAIADDAVTATTPAKRARVATDSGDGEDERSIEMHIAAMKQTWHSRSRDTALLSDRMLRTYSARREKIDDGITLPDLLDVYPALQDETQLQQEFVRLTNIDFMEKVKKYWSLERTNRALQQMSHDKHVHDYVVLAGSTNVLEHKQAIVCCLLPRVFGERTKSFFVHQKDSASDGSNLTVYPTVVSTACEPAQIISSDAVHELVFERRKICTCSSLLSATSLAVMAYYVFDVCFPKQLKNTFNFLDVYVGGMDRKTKIRSAVQRRINVLHAD